MPTQPPEPLVTVSVECLRDGTNLAVPTAQVRAVYFPTDGTPYMIFLCPGCNDAHRYRTSVEFLDSLRAGGAATDYPDIPDNPPDMGVPA